MWGQGTRDQGKQRKLIWNIRLLRNGIYIHQTIAISKRTPQFANGAMFEVSVHRTFEASVHRTFEVSNTVHQDENYDHLT